MINPDEYRVARVEGPEELIRRFRVRELHPDAEITALTDDGNCQFEIVEDDDASGE